MGEEGSFRDVSNPNAVKQKKTLIFIRVFRVEDRARTGDLRNHNPTL